MYEYEIHQVQQAELLRSADRQRLVGEARRACRTARRAGRTGQQGIEGRVSALRSRFVRAA